MEPKWISNSALLIILLSLQFELCFGLDLAYFAILSIPGCLICCCICGCTCLCRRIYSDEDYSKQQVKVIIVQSPNVPANPAPRAPTYIHYSRAGVESVPKEKLEVVKNVPANPEPRAPSYIYYSRAGVESVPKEKLEVVNYVPANPEAKTSANLSHPRGVDTEVVLPTRRSFHTSYPSDHPVFIRDPRKAYL